MTIGFVDWYDATKGFGLIKSVAADKQAIVTEYFLHCRNLNGCENISKGDIVYFIADYDHKRGRAIATKACIFSGKQDEWIVVKSYLGIDTQYANNIITSAVASSKATDGIPFIETVLSWSQTANLDEKLLLSNKKSLNSLTVEIRMVRA